MKTVTIEAQTSIESLFALIENSQYLFNQLNAEAQLQLEACNEMETALKEVDIQVDNTHIQVENSINRIEHQQKKVRELMIYCETLSELSDEILEKTYGNLGEEDVLFGVSPAVTPDELKKNYIPVLSTMFENIGLVPHFMIMKDYGDLKTKMKNGLLDFGWFSPVAYIQTREECDIKPMVTPLAKSENGESAYRGYIISRKDRRYTGLHDLKGKRFGYVDVNSGSGYRLANQILKEKNMDPEKIFRETVFLGSHEKVIKGVLDGEVDAGATFSGALSKAELKGVGVQYIDKLGHTPEIPRELFAASGTVTQEVFDALMTEFKKYTPDDDTAELVGFTQRTDDNYDIIRKLT
jgi:phosphate/phosphite/phosphonate ABC transporter binding protein